MTTSPNPAQHDILGKLTSPTYPLPVAHTANRSSGRIPSDEARQTKAAYLVEGHAVDASSQKFGSMSSGQTSLTTTTISSTDLEKKTGYSSQRSSRSKIPEIDLEKAVHVRQHSPRHSDVIHISHHTYREDDTVEEVRMVQAEKAVGTLLFLAGPCAILSALNAGWTLVSLIITLLSQPVRLCARRLSFGQQLGGLLGPALNLQLKCIHTPLAPHANEDTTYNPWILVMVQLLSPLLAIGMVLAAWVVAVYWVSSMVVGDPAGTDRRDDGREAALALRDWWESWLVRSIRSAEPGVL